MYKPTRHSYEKRMKNQRRKAKAGLLLATTLTAGMAVNPCPAVTGLASYLTGTGNVSVVQAAETLSISKENVTTIDLGKQEDKIDEDCVILTLDHDGTYILMGQNYMNDTWVDTQIQVPEGVTVNLILAEDFSIQNDDGAYRWNSSDWRGNSLTPFVIQGTANLYVDDTVKIHNSVSDKNYEGNTTHEFYRGLFRVDGTMTIKEVKDGAKIKLEQDVNNKAQWGEAYYDRESKEYKYTNDIPAVFEGTGTVILKEGTFDGTEISYPKVREGSEFKQGDAVTDNKITSKVAHLIIRGGNYNNIEIHKERVVDKYTVAGGTLEVEEGTFAKIDGEYVLDSCSVKTPADADEDFSVAMTNHDYGAADYSWSADKSTCTASRVCQKDKTHIETETATATSVITKQPTCTTAGERTYNAEFKNEAFATQTQTEAVAKKGHKYAAPTYSWSADKSTCTASRICQNDKTHVETEKATVTSAVTTQPTYEKTGVRTYTAAFKNAAFSTQTQTETIAKRVKPQENTPIQTKKTSIKKASVKGISNKNYNGKSQKQSIKVKLGKKTLKQGTDYTVSYKNNKNIGKATVTIKGKGKYEGSIKKTFQITVAKGKTYTAGNFKYKMTNASTNGKGTVTLAATKKSKSDSKFTSCKITDTVKIGGKTFKVTAIGDNAFKGYKKLKTITIESKNIKSVGKDAVKNIHKKATITVPKNKVKEYKKLFNKNTGFTSKMTIKKA